MSHAFPLLSDSERLARLALPSGTVRAVIDTDPGNEIDDQFALTYAFLSPDIFDLQAIYVAPFHNARSSGPGDGMRRSYEELQRLCDMFGRRVDGFIFRGSERWMSSQDEPVPSPAAEDLVSRARSSGEDPLYVIA